MFLVRVNHIVTKEGLIMQGDRIQEIWGRVEEGEVIEIFSDDFSASMPHLDGDTSLKISSVCKQEDGSIKVQGLVFRNTADERSATIVLDADYDDVDDIDRSVGWFTLGP